MAVLWMVWRKELGMNLASEIHFESVNLLIIEI